MTSSPGAGQRPQSGAGDGRRSHREPPRRLRPGPCRCRPVFALKIAKTGGPRAVLKVAHLAHAAGIGLYGGTMLEGSIGTLASAHAFATLERLDWHSELFGPLLLTEDILVEPPTYRDFQLLLPQGPGLGVSLDEDRLAHFRRDRSSLAVATA